MPINPLQQMIRDARALLTGLPPSVRHLRDQLDEPDVWTGPPPGLAVLVDARQAPASAWRRAGLPARLVLESGEYVAIQEPSGGTDASLAWRQLAGRAPLAEAEATMHLNGAAPLHHQHDVQRLEHTSHLLPWLTVIDNVALGLTGPDAHRRVRDALGLVGLSSQAACGPGSLTPAQRHAVALARALAHGPRLLLLDNPFRDLDATQRHHLDHLVEAAWVQYGFTLMRVLDHRDRTEDILADRIVST
jgi:sulfonate transport system ATP-binding protein